MSKKPPQTIAVETYELRPLPMGTVRVQPFWESLRGDPRFDDLLRRMGLPKN